MYSSGNIDKEIIESNVSVGISRIIELLQYFKYPEKSMINILDLEKEMKKHEMH